MEPKPKIRGVLLDTVKDKVEVVEFEPTLENYYRMLHCDMIEIAVRKIGVRNGKVFDIVCDEEGLFKPDNKISAINDLGKVMLVGSLLVVGLADEEGDETSLSEADALYVQRFIQKMYTTMHPEGYMMLTQCEYAR